MRPKIEVLARVKSKFKEPDVYLGQLGGDEDLFNNIRLPLGTHVFVIKTLKATDGSRYPVITCEYGMGWLYWDELERVDEVQAG